MLTRTLGSGHGVVRTSTVSIAFFGLVLGLASGLAFGDDQLFGHAEISCDGLSSGYDSNGSLSQSCALISFGVETKVEWDAGDEPERACPGVYEVAHAPADSRGVTRVSNLRGSLIRPLCNRSRAPPYAPVYAILTEPNRSA